jgi:hypothetical protein
MDSDRLVEVFCSLELRKDPEARYAKMLDLAFDT